MLPWEALLLIKAVHTNSCEEGSKQDIVCMTHGNQPRKKQMSLLAFHLVHFDLNLVDCETMHQLDCFACRRDLLSGCRGLANVYHWNIKIIQLPPCIRLGQSQVDFLVGKWSLIPYIRQHTLCLCAEVAVVTAEKGDATGLQKTPRSEHGWRRSLLACLADRHGRLSSQAFVWWNEPLRRGGDKITPS